METVSASKCDHKLPWLGVGGTRRSVEVGGPRPQAHSVTLAGICCCLAPIPYPVAPVFTGQCTRAWVGQRVEKGPGH